jgi:capsular polysaccharide biosynthesis protein
LLYDGDARALNRRARGSGGMGQLEIGDYLRIIWRRLWILLLVPSLAGGLVWWNTREQPLEYSATATVAAPWLVGDPSSQYSGARGSDGFVADFAAATTHQAVLKRVSGETGVPLSDIGRGLTTTPVEESVLIEVTYTALGPQEATRVVASVAEETLRFLFEPQIDLAQSASRSEIQLADPDIAKRIEFFLDHPDTVTVGLAEPVSPYAKLVSNLLVAVGAGLFLAFFIVVLLEVVVSGPSAREVAVPERELVPPEDLGRERAEAH